LGVAVCYIIQPVGGAALAVVVQYSGEGYKHIPGEIPVIGEKIPTGAEQDGDGQQNRYEYTEEFFHMVTPFSIICCNYILFKTQSQETEIISNGKNDP
jgi:hypothetical protein